MDVWRRADHQPIAQPEREPLTDRFAIAHYLAVAVAVAIAHGHGPADRLL